MDFESEPGIVGQLDSGERLIWSGRPGGGLRVRRGDWFMIPFSLLWGGFAFFWEWMAIRQGAPLLARVWGGAFVLVGTHLVAGRFFWDARRRSHTYYAVTDRRVLLVTSRWPRNTTTLPLRSIPAITLAEREDGTGDVVFDSTDAGHVGIGGRLPRGSSVPTMLEFIPNARRVYDLIRDAQRRAV